MQSVDKDSYGGLKFHDVEFRHAPNIPGETITEEYKEGGKLQHSIFPQKT